MPCIIKDIWFYVFTKEDPDVFCSVCQTPMMHILPKGGRLKRICIKCQKEQITVESHFRGTTAAMHANRGMNFFVQQEFDHAEREFRAAAKKARNCPEYYWAELLAKCGVTYCKQEINRGQDVKYVLDIWKKNVFTESKEREALFEKVKKYSADRETECLKYYKREFEIIDAKLRQIDNERKSAKAYDIFLCYKDTGDDSEVTPERVLLDQQYKLLSKKYKVFFAPCTLHENYTLVDDFSGSIYHALESAKLLVVVSSSERYVNSSWVCSEWKRYYDWNGKRRSSILTCCLGSMRPEHFPDQLRSIQMKNEPIQYQATGDDETPYLFDDVDVQQFYNTIIEKYKAASKGKIKVLSIVAAGALCLTIAVASRYGANVLHEIKALLPDSSQQQTAAVQFLYEVNSSGGYTITGYKGPENTFIYIPEEVGGTPVSEIGEEAFADASITGVHIPGTIKIVGDKAFWGCNQMESAILEEGIEEVGFCAFGHCISLENLNLPASINRIDSIIPYCPSLTELKISEQAIDLKVESGFLIANESVIIGVMGKLDSISIPAGIEQLHRVAFWNQDGITNVIIPEGVKEIEGECFRTCDNLESVTLPASIELIGDNAFADCPKLKTIYGWNDTARNLANKLGIDFVELKPTPTPAPKTTLSAEMFAKAQKLIKDIEYEVNSEGGITITKYTGEGGGDIVIPDIIDGKYVTEIGIDAFKTSAITGVYIPGSVKIINRGSFWNSDQLLEAVLEEGIENIRIGAFGDCDHLKKLNIPASVKSIGSIIYDCPELTDLTVAKESTWIKVEGDYLITNSKNIIGVKGLLQKIDIPEGIEIFWEYVFRDQDHLTSIEIPEGIKKIQDECFRYCDNLETVTLPASIETIGDNAFVDCPKLKTIYGMNDVARKQAEDLGIEYIDLTAPTPTPAPKTSLSAERYAKAQKLIKDIEYEVNSEGGITITKYTGADGVDIVIPDVIEGKYVTEIGENAFKESAITGVYIPGAVKTIREYAFYNSDQLVEAVLEEGIREIQSSAFGHCDHLRKLNIPASVKSIGSIIPYSPELTEMTVAKENAWLRMEGDLLIGDGKRGTSIFGVKGLPETIVIPDGIEILWSAVFWGQDRMTSIEIPEGVKEIQSECFRYSDNLTSVALPFSIETIEKNAFADCPKLKVIGGSNPVAEALADSLGAGYPWTSSTKNRLKVLDNGRIVTEPYRESINLEYFDKSALEAYRFERDFEYKKNADGTLTLTKYTGKGKSFVIVPGEINGMKVTELGDTVFQSNLEITHVTLCPSIEKIGTNSFEHCLNLKELKILGDLESYGKYALSRAGIEYDLKIRGIPGTRAESMAEKYNAIFIEIK